MLRKTIIVCPAIIWCLYLYRGINIQIYNTHFIWRVTNIIEAHKGCDVSVIDLPNAFLNADNNEQTPLMFIVEKRNGDIKARKCAVGSKQRTFPGYVKSEWDSPTISTDSVIITFTIEAHQGRDVAVIDLPNAFLNADNF